MRGGKVCRSVRAVVYVGLVGVSVAELLLGHPAWAVTFETMNGAPVQMQPYVDEPGAPAVTVPLGTAQPFGGLSGSAGSGSGSTGGGTEALNTMLGTPWGADAVAAAQSIGVNPATLAATCVVESTSCDSSARNGSFVGAFQMGPAAFTDGIAAALAANPALASQIVPGSAGINDPTTNAIAAAGYMLKGANSLEASGVSSPTFAQVRGQGCSTLPFTGHSEQHFDAAERGAVAVLGERACSVRLENVVAEAAQSGEHARIAPDAGCVLAHGDVAAVVRGVLYRPVRADAFGGSLGGDGGVGQVVGGMGRAVPHAGGGAASEDIALDADDCGDMGAPFRIGDTVGGIEHGDAAAFMSVARRIGAVRAGERLRVGTAQLNLPMQTWLVVLELDDQIDAGLSGGPECFLSYAGNWVTP